MSFRDDLRSHAIKGLTSMSLAAVLFYEGDVNNGFLPKESFDEETRKEPKAFVTLNTLLEGNNAEEQRFQDGKLQTPKLITREGIEKMLSLYGSLYRVSLHNPVDTNIKLCALKRCSELNSSFIRSLNKLFISVDI